MLKPTQNIFIKKKKRFQENRKPLAFVRRNGGKKLERESEDRVSAMSG